jgi:hypothetical protein
MAERFRERYRLIAELISSLVEELEECVRSSQTSTEFDHYRRLREVAINLATQIEDTRTDIDNRLAANRPMMLDEMRRNARARAVVLQTHMTPTSFDGNGYATGLVAALASMFAEEPIPRVPGMDQPPRRVTGERRYFQPPAPRVVQDPERRRQGEGRGEGGSSKSPR